MRTEQVIAEIVRNCDMRKTLKELAAEHNLSITTMRKYLLSAGLTRQNARVSDRLLADHRAGMTDEEVAAKHGISVGYVKNVRIQMGLPRIMSQADIDKSRETRNLQQRKAAYQQVMAQYANKPSVIYRLKMLLNMSLAMGAHQDYRSQSQPNRISAIARLIDLVRDAEISEV